MGAITTDNDETYTGPLPHMIEMNGGLMGIIEGSEDIQDHPLRPYNGSNAMYTSTQGEPLECCEYIIFVRRD